MNNSSDTIPNSLAPWLSVPNGWLAVEFYKNAFGAELVYTLETPDGLVARLAVGSAEFWLSGGSIVINPEKIQELGGGTVRMVLTVDDPDEFFKQALDAGASEIFPVGEDHGWRLGRLADPFGLHWEIGRPVS